MPPDQIGFTTSQQDEFCRKQLENKTEINLLCFNEEEAQKELTKLKIAIDSLEVTDIDSGNKGSGELKIYVKVRVIPIELYTLFI